MVTRTGFIEGSVCVKNGLIASKARMSSSPPRTLQATTSRPARQPRHLKNIAGAPNVVRGGSLAGNASALDIARQELLDILSSDYMPMSLAYAAFILHDKLGIPVSDVSAKASSNVADAHGFDDHGETAPGKRADLVRVTLVKDVPVVGEIWRQGMRIN